MVLKVFISGGAGFLAANVIERLIETHEVVVLDTLQRNSLKFAPWSSHPNLTIVKGDVRDAALVERCARGADYVLHMAAIAGVSVVVNNPAMCLTVNIQGTQNVLEAARKVPNLRRLIDFSTSEVYGPNVYRAQEDGATTQGSVYQPRWYYAVSKLASEFLCHAYHSEYGMPTVGIRPFNVYGPYQTGEGCVRNFIHAALQNEPLYVHGDGDQIRSWCYVDDMTRSILKAMTEEGAIGRHINIGNPRATTSTLELAHTVLRLSGSTSEIVFKKIAYPDVEVRVPDVSEMQQNLGVKAEVGLEEGLQRTIDWWRMQ
jgi:UDP-glucose 4-epimerase